MNFRAILAKFHKKLDVNLFKLVIDLDFDNAQKRVPQKTNSQSLAFS
jgi:hypothetical protein